MGGSQSTSSSANQMHICVMGPPGSGKGTVSEAIVEHFGICQISTGDELRNAVKARTPAGLRAKDLMDAGQLVSNDIVFEIVKDAMKRPECTRGWLLDGLPRTVEQARVMDEANFGIQRVVGLSVPDDIVLDRICGRWTHPASGRTYHVKFRPPKSSNADGVPLDDVTGEVLTQRPDDTYETGKKRLRTFHEKTEPIYDYYRSQRKFDLIDGNRPIEVVRNALLSLLAGFFTPIKALPQ